jgi:hypothetical protein
VNLAADSGNTRPIFPHALCFEFELYNLTLYKLSFLELTLFVESSLFVCVFKHFRTKPVHTHLLIPLTRHSESSTPRKQNLDVKQLRLIHNERNLF